MTIYNIAADQLALDDDIFARPPRALARQQATTARITCRVCELKDDVPLTHAPGPLCRACGEDLPRTKAKVKQWLDGVLAQIDHEVARFRALQDAHPDFVAKLEAARGDPDFVAKAATHRKAGNVYGRLLEAEAEMRRACEPLGVERSRLERAVALLDTLSAPVVLAAGEYVLPTGVDVEACRSCGASIVWSKTAAGKPVPLSLALVEERGGSRVTKTHFVDCPDGRGWKK